MFADRARPIRSFLGGFVVISTFCLALTACSDIPESAPKAAHSVELPTPTPSPTPSPKPEPSPTATTPSEPSADPNNPDPLPDFTTPGTRLSFGESMIVQEPAGFGTMETGWAVVKYTVTAIEDGDPAVLDAYRKDDKFANATPYYIRGQIEVIALFGNAIDGDVGGSIDGVQDDFYSSFSLFGLFADDACKGSFRLASAQVGDVQDTCLVTVARDSTKLVAVAYSLLGSQTGDPYYDDPVAWMP